MLYTHSCMRTQACRRELECYSAPNSSSILKMAAISSIALHGMDFTPDSWMLSYPDNGVLTELVYVASMYCISGAPDVVHTAYLKVFRFSLKKLGAAIDANLIRIQTAAFQKMLDEAPTQACHCFTPTRCPLRGRWVWTLKVFKEYVKPGACRVIHLSNMSATTMTFVFR